VALVLIGCLHNLERATMGKKYIFWIRRKWDSSLEQVDIYAMNSFEAVRALPECVYWDLSRSKNKD